MNRLSVYDLSTVGTTVQDSELLTHPGLRNESERNSEQINGYVVTPTLLDTRAWNNAHEFVDSVCVCVCVCVCVRACVRVRARACVCVCV